MIVRENSLKFSMALVASVCTFDYYSSHNKGGRYRWGRRKARANGANAGPRDLFPTRCLGTVVAPQVKGPPQSSPHSHILASFLHPRHFTTTYTTTST